MPRIDSRRSLFPLPTLLLAGCVADYTHPAGEPTARVKLARKAMPLICAAEKPIRLVPDADGYARVPAGRPITLIAQFEGHDFVCMPGVSFTAAADASYEQTLRVVSRACYTTIVDATGALVASAPEGSYGCRGRP